MKFQVKIKRRLEKKLKKLPLIVQKKLGRLVIDLKDNGPVQSHWPNFSKLNDNKFHCHLGYSWVACWQCEKDDIIIEVYYVGSREKAPY